MRPDDDELLQRFAAASNTKVISTRTDLASDDSPHPDMMAWCKRQGDIVVLSNGNILSSKPSSRSIQNCKVVMINKGMRPGKVLATKSALIQVLLAATEDKEQKNSIDTIPVSEQQQRLRSLVKEAIAAEASDIHMEVRSDITRIRFRKHGELYLHTEWLPNISREVASVAFNKETDHAVTHFNPLVPQNASMPLNIDGNEVRLRLATMPAHGGFDLVMRILTTEDSKVPKLEALGYSPQQIKLIKKAVALPYGAVIMSGPTGSGKTTTLASCMGIVSAERKIYTIEDPVEKIVHNASQVPVNTEQYDRSFASMGRASLRMDPDVIVLGEMRDEDTAGVMVRAAITGHLVFSTLHTNTATGIVTRLVDMGISPNLLSDPNLLACLICQRLVPKLCQYCAQPLTTSSSHQPYLARWQSVFGENLNTLKVRGKNCDHCKGLGVSGRTVVAEIIWIDEQSRYFIQRQDILGWEKYLKQNGWQTYKEQALELVKQGICDILDVERLVGELTSFSSKSFNYRDSD